MPVYEYRCNDCGEAFELFLRSVAESAAPSCPKCGSSDVRKAVSLFGVAGASERNRIDGASCGPAPT